MKIITYDMKESDMHISGSTMFLHCNKSIKINYRDSNYSSSLVRHTTSVGEN